MNESYRPETPENRPLKPTKLAKGLGLLAALGLAGGVIAGIEANKSECSEVPVNAFEHSLDTSKNPVKVLVDQGVSIRFSPAVCEGEGVGNGNLVGTTTSILSAVPSKLYSDPSDPNGPWNGFNKEELINASPLEDRPALTAAFKNDKDGDVWVNIREGVGDLPK